MVWTPPETFTAGEAVTAAKLNTNLRDNLLHLTDWVSYTPTWTDASSTPSIGNGTLEGAYISVGDLTFVRIRLLWGSTTSDSGSTQWRLSLPTAATVANTSLSGLAVESGAAPHVASGLVLGSYVAAVGASAWIDKTSPFTWGAGDQLIFTGVYES